MAVTNNALNDGLIDPLILDRDSPVMSEISVVGTIGMNTCLFTYIMDYCILSRAIKKTKLSKPHINC